MIEMKDDFLEKVSPYDVSKLLQADLARPAYGSGSAFHYWGEPYFGYCLPNGERIIRKHAQLLSDAGIDVNIPDVTNAAVQISQVRKITETYRALRKSGISTPSIAFVVNIQPKKNVQRLFDSIYIYRIRKG